MPFLTRRRECGRGSYAAVRRIPNAFRARSLITSVSRSPVPATLIIALAMSSASGSSVGKSQISQRALVGGSHRLNFVGPNSAILERAAKFGQRIRDQIICSISAGKDLRPSAKVEIIFTLDHYVRNMTEGILFTLMGLKDAEVYRHRTAKKCS